MVALLIGLCITLTGLGPPVQAAAYEVTTLVHIVDPADGKLSLREAVALAVEGGQPAQIIFASNVRGSIHLLA